MNSSKVWILITGIILMASGFLLYTTIKSKDAERAISAAKTQELNGKLIELAQVQADLAELKKEKAELEAQTQADVAALETQISEYKKTEMQLRAKIDTLSKEKESLSKYMDNNSVIVNKLQKKVELLEREKKETRETIEKARQTDNPSPRFVDPMDAQPPMETKAEMGAKLAADEMVDLGRIIIGYTTNQPAQVEHVNTLYGFIVIGAGTDDGLRKDSIINITRNNRLIAKAVIKKIRNNASSAATLSEWTREEIKVGDFISVNTPAPTATAPR